MHREIAVMVVVADNAVLGRSADIHHLALKRMVG